MKTRPALLSVSSKQLEGAYQWLCQQRRHKPDNADIWDFRFHWAQCREGLLHEINCGDYLFSPLQRICKANGKVIHLWCARDALVIKCLSEVLADSLNISDSCTHIKGHGGLKQTIVQVQQQLKDYDFVCKTDVKQFYESIDQILLMQLVYKAVDNILLRRYLWQIIRRTIDYGGNYREISRGISRGCSISPLLGALYLSACDEAFAGLPVFYVRYMDDILILSKTRWQNRRVVKVLNRCFEELKVVQHPDKTFIGKIEKGFDFLGYYFSREPLTLARNTVKHHVQCIYRLYEQQIKKKATVEEVALVLGEYIKRWQCWCSAGLNGFSFSFVYGELYRSLEVLKLKE